MSVEPWKAYDWVLMEELWFCMRVSGVAERNIRLLQDMCDSNMRVGR